MSDFFIGDLSQYPVITPSGADTVPVIDRSGTPHLRQALVSSLGAFDIDQAGNFDSLFGPDLGYDEEFLLTTTSLPSGYSWQDQNSASYAEANGRGVISAPSAGTGISGLVTPLTGLPGTFTAYARVSYLGDGTNYGGPTIGLRRGTTTAVQGLVYTNGFQGFFSNSGAFSGSYYGPVGGTVFSQPRPLIGLVYHSATSADFIWSVDGVNWFLLSNWNPTTQLGGAPTDFMFGATRGSGVSRSCFEWIRFR